MAERDKFPGQMVCRRAGLHADQARRQLGKERRQFAAYEPAGQNNLVRFINTMHLENALRNIEADCATFHVDARSLDMATLTTPP